MNADIFVETNVLLDTIDEDPASASKRQRAQELLLSQRWGWSVPVAAEFFVNATSPKRPFRLTPPDAAIERPGAVRHLGKERARADKAQPMCGHQLFSAAEL